MKTAVQLRSGDGTAGRVRCAIVYGPPHASVPGRLGPVAIFEPGAIVAYEVSGGRRARLFVFRTLVVDDRLAATVPGVWPRVRLLAALRTAGRARLAARLFAYLLRSGRCPCGMPDAFYVRVGAVLAGRLPRQKVLRSLLVPRESEEPWTR
jgi:hypothetical protein